MSVGRRFLPLLPAFAALFALSAPVRCQDATPTDAARLEYELQKKRVEEVFRSKLPLPPPQVPKAINGADNRQDVLELPDGKIKRAAQSTCLLTSKSRLTATGDQYDLALEDYRVASLQCCTGERFGNQKRGGWCSGFLAGSDIVVTAGHCCDDSDASVQAIGFIFGFAVDAAGNTPSRFAKDRVYFGKRLIKRQHTSRGDFAIIQLDRPVTVVGAVPLSVAPLAPSANEGIVLIGYPAGLPCKSADGAKVMEQVPGGSWLRTNCDAYAGNSGSAVVNSDGVVVGILVRGNLDFTMNTVGGVNCFESLRYRDSDGNEVLTRPEIFRADIPVAP
jgi:hypothetical protein